MFYWSLYIIYNLILTTRWNLNISGLTRPFWSTVYWKPLWCSFDWNIVFSPTKRDMCLLVLLRTHYLPGAAASSCVPACPDSWCCPDCTASAPEPGSLSSQRPAARRLPAAGPGCPCRRPSPGPGACSRLGSFWWDLRRANGGETTKKFS